VDELVSVDGVSEVFQINGINNSFNSLISSSLDVGAMGRSGNITINSGALSLTNGGQISSSTFGNGDAGTITVDVDNDILLENGNVTFTNGTPIPITSSIFSNVGLTNAVGNAGEINITANNLFARNGGVITSSTFGQGNAGDINLDINELVSFDGRNQIEQTLSASGIGSNVESGAVGNGGVIDLTAKNLSLTNGAQIQTLVRRGQTFNGQEFAPGDGIGGNIIIDVDELVSVDGVSEVFQINGINNSFNSLISSSLDVGAASRSGNITINAGSLSLTNGGQISSSTFGNGDAGTITVDVDNDILLENGNVTFTNGTPIRFNNGIFSTVESGAIGNGGDVTIATPNLNINNSGQISVSSFGNGNAGNLKIDASSIVLDNAAAITGSTLSGTGGNITFNGVDRLDLRGNSEISAGAFGDASGGIIIINAQEGFVVAFPSGNAGNDIIANAERGQGGTITINAQGVLGFETNVATNREETSQGFGSRLDNGTNDLDVTSASGSNLDGTVTLNVPDTDSLQGTIETPENPIPEQATTAEACAASPDTGETNGLTVKGKGGTLPTPEAPLNAEVLNIGGKIAAERSSSIPLENGEENEIDPVSNYEIQPIMTDDGPIYPAMGVLKTPDGQTILTPYPTDNVATRTPTKKPNCRS
jgi:large exoprotein involved in heme utilization and adhesion